mmetsp:Transcript_20710/g.70148  ORF Transcript_20710/g.70148 Transcript_20710/m.70148 type:complete len:426 (-) Transcript_20710:9-1286(-)
MQRFVRHVSHRRRPRRPVRRRLSRGRGFAVLCVLRDGRRRYQRECHGRPLHLRRPGQVPALPKRRRHLRALAPLQGPRRRGHEEACRRTSCVCFSRWIGAARFVAPAARRHGGHARESGNRVERVRQHSLQLDGGEPPKRRLPETFSAHQGLGLLRRRRRVCADVWLGAVDQGARRKPRPRPDGILGPMGRRQAGRRLRHDVGEPGRARLQLCYHKGRGPHGAAVPAEARLGAAGALCVRRENRLSEHPASRPRVVAPAAPFRARRRRRHARRRGKILGRVQGGWHVHVRMAFEWFSGGKRSRGDSHSGRFARRRLRLRCHFHPRRLENDALDQGLHAFARQEPRAPRRVRHGIGAGRVPHVFRHNLSRLRRALVLHEERALEDGHHRQLQPHDMRVQPHDFGDFGDSYSLMTPRPAIFRTIFCP